MGMTFRRFGVPLIALALLCATFVSTPLSAQEATPAPANLVLPPDAEVAGLTLGEWQARQWQYMASFPFAGHPVFDDTGAMCGVGQSGPVFLLADSGVERPIERSCTVPEGIHVLVPLGGVECSTVEPAPFFGRNEEELRQCANQLMDQVGLNGVTVSVNGVEVPDLETYQSESPLFTLTLPEDNLFRAPAGVAHAVADGFQIMVGPLPAGEHEIVVRGPGPGGANDMRVTYLLNVQAPQVIDPNAEAATPIP